MYIYLFKKKKQKKTTIIDIDIVLGLLLRDGVNGKMLIFYPDCRDQGLRLKIISISYSILKIHYIYITTSTTKNVIIKALL